MKFLFGLMLLLAVNGLFASTCSVEDSLAETLNRYIKLDDKAHGYEVQAGHCKNIINGSFFENAGKGEYEDNVRIVDSFLEKSPYRINDLLIELQLRWENKHLADYLGDHKLAMARKNLLMMTGILLGSGVAVLRNPFKSYKYKELLEGLMPALISSGSGPLFKTGFIENNIPVPPALLSGYGSVFKEGHEREQEKYINDLKSLGAGTSAGTLVYLLGQTAKAANTANKVLTPLKWNLLVLAGSIVVGVGVEMAAEKALSTISKNSLKKLMQKRRVELLNADVRDPSMVIKAAKSYVSASHNYAFYHFLPVLLKIEDFKKDEAKIMKKKGKTNKWKLKKLRKKFASLQSDVESIIFSMPRRDMIDIVMLDALNALEKVDSVYVEIYKEAAINEINNFNNILESFGLME